MTLLLFGFMVLAAIGFALSVCVHIAAWAGIEPPAIAMGLHVGIFVVWIPAVLVAQRLARGSERRDVWKAVLRGVPGWLQIAGKLLFGYALVNFAVFFFRAPKHGPAPEIDQFRGFSGHWMLFYGAAFGILYSARRVGVLDHERKCLNGHLVSGVANSCEHCGAPVITK